MSPSIEQLLTHKKTDRPQVWFTRAEVLAIIEARDSANWAQDTVHDLLWSEHLECCGNPTATNHGVHGWEEHCCGCPEPAMLNDKQIVATLRAKFPQKP